MNRWELRNSDSTSAELVGTACVFNAPYEMSSYVEVVKPGAFRHDLENHADVTLNVEHTGMPLARTTNGSLQLRETSEGLACKASLNLLETDAALVVSKMRSGILDGQMSFEFRAVEQTWSPDYSERTLEKVSIDRGAVSIVTQAANPATSSTIRSLEQREGFAAAIGTEFRASSYELRRPFTQKERDGAAADGTALEDGSFPIKSRQDLLNAIRAYGRAKDPVKVKLHIIKRARALGLVSLLPESWNITRSFNYPQWPGDTGLTDKPDAPFKPGPGYRPTPGQINGETCSRCYGTGEIRVECPNCTENAGDGVELPPIALSTGRSITLTDYRARAEAIRERVKGKR